MPSHDPDVEYLSAALHRSRLSNEIIAQIVGHARHAKMSPSTVAALRDLRTRRPTNHTLTWIAFALGLRRKWEKM